MWARRYQVWSRDQYEYRGVDVINVLLGINALVFGGWWLAPPRFMRENFVSTLRNLREGRVWTLITPAFSHQSPMHLLFNSMAMWVLGKEVMFVLGPSRTLLLYLAAGVVSCVCHLAYVNEIKPRIMASTPRQYQLYKMVGAEQGALGMSGSVMGISILYAAFFPSAILLLYGVVPVRAPILVGGFIAADLLFAFSAPESSISHAGHLGGALYGLLYALYLRRRFGRR